MIYLEYTRKGTPISDFEAEGFVNDLIRMHRCGQTIHRLISTSLSFDFLRLFIAAEKIQYFDVIFIYDGKEIHINKYGAIEDWPEGFCGYGSYVAEKILRIAMAKKKMEG
jgi:hypothetical protein